MERVAVAIATLNEAATIGTVIDSVPSSELRAEGLEAVMYVIDGQSTGGTLNIARRKGARIIRDGGTGKSAAMRAAFEHVDADYVIMVDGDGTYPIEVVSQMVRLLRTHDVVIGSRLKGTIEPGAMTRLNVLGNTLLSLLARILYDANISDLCTGLWGFRRDALQCLDLTAQGFELEADIFAEAVTRGLQIAEIPISYRARRGRPKLSSVTDSLKIGTFLIHKRRAVRREDRIKRSTRPATSVTSNTEHRSPVDRSHAKRER
jgi:glycosyltransferase involved in cell wall biosynthesis